MFRFLLVLAAFFIASAKTKRTLCIDIPTKERCEEVAALEDKGVKLLNSTSYPHGCFRENNEFVWNSELSTVPHTEKWQPACEPNFCHLIAAENEAVTDYDFRCNSRHLELQGKKVRCFAGDIKLRSMENKCGVDGFKCECNPETCGINWQTQMTSRRNASLFASRCENIHTVVADSVVRCRAKLSAIQEGELCTDGKCVCTDSHKSRSRRSVGRRFPGLEHASAHKSRSRRSVGRRFPGLEHASARRSRSRRSVRRRVPVPKLASDHWEYSGSNLSNRQCKAIGSSRHNDTTCKEICSEKLGCNAFNYHKEHGCVFRLCADPFTEPYGIGKASNGFGSYRFIGKNGKIPVLSVSANESSRTSGCKVTGYLGTFSLVIDCAHACAEHTRCTHFKFDTGKCYSQDPNGRCSDSKSSGRSYQLDKNLNPHAIELSTRRPPTSMTFTTTHSQAGRNGDLLPGPMALSVRMPATVATTVTPPTTSTTFTTHSKAGRNGDLHPHAMVLPKIPATVAATATPATTSTTFTTTHSKASRNGDRPNRHVKFPNMTPKLRLESTPTPPEYAHLREVPIPDLIKRHNAITLPTATLTTTSAPRPSESVESTFRAEASHTGALRPLAAALSRMPATGATTVTPATTSTTFTTTHSKAGRNGDLHPHAAALSRMPATVATIITPPTTSTTFTTTPSKVGGNGDVRPNATTSLPPSVPLADSTESTHTHAEASHNEGYAGSSIAFIVCAVAVSVGLAFVAVSWLSSRLGQDEDCDDSESVSSVAISTTTHRASSVSVFQV